MDLYPAIDVRGGNVVRLQRGDYDAETTYSGNPVAVARDFAMHGARWIHVVDLDAARDGGSANLATIEAICAAVPQCRIQTGGGIRDAAAAFDRLACGVARVVVGSAAVETPELVEELVAHHPQAVAVGLDVRGREVSTHGWTRTASDDLFELVRAFSAMGAAAFIVTQIDVDGLLTGPDTGLYAELLDVTDVPVIASGGVGSVDDLVALAQLAGAQRHERRLAGVIAGKAIYERRFTVREGIAACSPSA